MSEKRVSFASKDKVHEYTLTTNAEGAGISHEPSPLPFALGSPPVTRKRSRPAETALAKAAKRKADAEQRWLVAEIERSNTEFDSNTKDDARGSAGRERAREKKMRHAHKCENLKDEAIEAYVQTRIKEASEDNVELHAKIVALHRRLEVANELHQKAVEVIDGQSCAGRLRPTRRSVPPTRRSPTSRRGEKAVNGDGTRWTSGPRVCCDVHG